MTDRRSSLGINAPNSIGIYGLSWGNAYGGSTRSYNSATWSIFEMILWIPSKSKFFATPRACERCMTQLSTYLHLWWRGRALRQIIRPPATINPRPGKLGLQSRTYFPHPCRMSWRNIKINISTWPMKNGVTSCPPLRLNTKGKGQKTI